MCEPVRYKCGTGARALTLTSFLIWPINESTECKKITYRKMQKKNSKNANSTMNVSAKLYNRNAKDYPTL